MVSKLTDSEIEGLLINAQHGYLGCHASGKTYVVPISFAYDGERLIGYTSAGQKIDMMRANPDVCVAVDEITDLTHWKTVIVNGRYEELSGSQSAIALGLLIDKYGPIFEEHPADDRRGREITPPREDGGIAARIVYCIHIDAKSGRTEHSNA